MHRLLYVSRSAVLANSPELADIAKVSLSRNSSCGVTGYLYFDNETFVQVLEGMPEDVADIYHSIEQDNRHADLRLLGIDEVTNRVFGSWAMGFYDGSERGGLISEAFGDNIAKHATGRDIPELTRFLRDLSVGRQDVYVLAPRDVTSA
ncbi:MAG: BLUF domain-containing protein [Pseudomonadota bacterium]